MMRRAGRYLQKLAQQILWMPLLLPAFLSARDDRVWIFGAWHGATFSDNSRYLFEHVIAEHPEITAVWLTKNRALAAQLARKGKLAFPAYSWRGIAYALRAKFHLVTHNANDVNAHALGRGLLINLTHGTPLKRMEYDARSSRLGLFTPLFDRYARYVLPQKRTPDYIFCASETARHRFASAFRIPTDRVHASGYPRWQGLQSRDRETLLASAAYRSLRDYSKIFLYAPTLREEGRGSLSMDATPDTVALMTWLKHTRAALLIRPHPSLRISIDRHLTASYPGYLRICHPDTYPDTNALLLLSDALITDYSSIMYDYAVLRRPVILHAPDLEAYIHSDVGIYGDYETDMPGAPCRSWKAVRNQLQIETAQHKQPTQRLQSFCQEHVSLAAGAPAERIVKFLKALPASMPRLAASESESSRVK